MGAVAALADPFRASRAHALVPTRHEDVRVGRIHAHGALAPAQAERGAPQLPTHTLGAPLHGHQRRRRYVHMYVVRVRSSHDHLSCSAVRAVDGGMVASAAPSSALPPSLTLHSLSEEIIATSELARRRDFAGEPVGDVHSLGAAAAWSAEDALVPSGGGLTDCAGCVGSSLARSFDARRSSGVVGCSAGHDCRDNGLLGSGEPLHRRFRMLASCRRLSSA